MMFSLSAKTYATGVAEKRAVRFFGAQQPPFQLRMIRIYIYSVAC